VHDPTSTAPPKPLSLLLPEVASKDFSGRDGGAIVQSELKALNRSALLNYGHLLSACLDTSDESQTTAAATAAREEKVSDVALLHLNMLHMLNGYREHEGLDNLVKYQEDCVKRRRLTVDTLHKAHTTAIDIVQRAMSKSEPRGEGGKEGLAGQQEGGTSEHCTPPTPYQGKVAAHSAPYAVHPDAALLDELNSL
jgi:hypothetical protein